MDRMKLLMVAKRRVFTNKVRILFSKFLCAAGRVMRNQIKNTEAVKVKVKPKGKIILDFNPIKAGGSESMNRKGP